MSCVSVTVRFLITHTSTDQSTIVGIPSVDCRPYFVDGDAAGRGHALDRMVGQMDFKINSIVRGNSDCHGDGAL
jgi:hypothetical protein